MEMENGAGTGAEKLGIFLPKSGHEDERKDSEADDMFEEAMYFTPDSARVQTMQQQWRFSGLGSGDGDEKLGKGQGGEDYGSYERFEEAMDRPDEDRGHGEVKMEGAIDFDAGDGEGDAAASEPVESNGLGITGDGNGIDVGKKDAVVHDKSENGELVNVTTDEVGIERGGVDGGKCTEGIPPAIELNGSEANGVDGKGEGDGKEVLGGMVNHKEEKDESTDVVLCEKSENGDFDKMGLNDALAVVLQGSEDRNFDDAGKNVKLSVVLETREKGDFGKEGITEMLAVVLEKSENGDFDGVHAEKETECVPVEDEIQDIENALVDTSVNEEKIPHQDDIRQMDDAMANVRASVNEENIPPTGDGSQKVEDALVGVGGSVDEEKIIYEDESQQMKDASFFVCNSVNADEISSADTSQQMESVTVEEYDESNSSDDDDSELIMQPAQVVHSSAVNPTHLPPPPAPAGLGSSAPLLEPAPRALQQPRVNGTTPQRQPQLVEDAANGEAEEYDETREKLQMIRVKFLRLAHRLGQTPHNVVVAQVLYRLGLAEQLRGSRNTSRAGAFSFDRASAMAEQLEAAGQEALDFSCTIMVLGKTGVGKSATINSIFDEVKFSTDAFKVGTTKVQDIVGMVQGIKVRVIDTPGLLSSCMDQRQNEKILHSVKRFIKKTPPDIVLYLDRLDMQSRDFGDVPLLRTITDIFGPSIWFNAIVVLTHAASAPPDGPNGTPLSYEMFVTQRSHVVQQAIRQAAGDVRLMNPVSLVENHSACRTNRAGQRVLPNGQVWKPQLLLLSFASKILAEANTLLKLQDSPPGKPFTARARAPPLPFLLSSLLQSRPQLKLPEEQFGDDDTMDEDLDDASDSDDESEYDELPPFKRLTKAQLAKLSKLQKKAYLDELEYRERLFMKKQLKEEKIRRKLLKKMAASAKDLPNDYNENLEEESGGAASVPVPVPDMPLPASFDSDNPTHRYRYLDNSNQWLIRPVLDNHGWDHDVGYEGLNVERLFVVKDKIPVSFSGQVTKDKKECNLQMELASSIKHGEGRATSLGFDAQNIGKDMAYTLRSETKFVNFMRNKLAAGLSFTMLGDALTAGLKLEDKLMIHKRLRLVMTGGAMTSRGGDIAYGGSLEATLRDKDHPIGRTLTTLGLSIMDWHGDLAIGCNIQSQFPVGRTTNMIARANLNNRGSGQVSLRLNSSEQLQIALIALIPVFRNIIKNRLFASSQPM